MPPKTAAATPEKKFALEVVFNRMGSRSFVRPDALSMNNLLGGYTHNSDITQAASFKTVQEARNYWATIRSKFEDDGNGYSFLLAKVVEVETVTEVQVNEVSPALNAPEDSELFYVLTRAGYVGREYRTESSSGTYTILLEKAARFRTVSSAVRGAVLAQSGMRQLVIDVSGIAAFRETTSTAFKITEVEILKNDAGFQTFVVESSVVRSISYNPASRRFRIALKRATAHDDVTYEYVNVDPTDVFQFLGAQSKGAYYGRTFKAKYSSSKKV